MTTHRIAIELDTDDDSARALRKAVEEFLAGKPEISSPHVVLSSVRDRENACIKEERSLMLSCDDIFDLEPDLI
jgi:hypothetical protein